MRERKPTRLLSIESGWISYLDLLFGSASNYIKKKSKFFFFHIFFSEEKNETFPFFEKAIPLLLWFLLLSESNNIFLDRKNLLSFLLLPLKLCI